VRIKSKINIKKKRRLRKTFGESMKKKEISLEPMKTLFAFENNNYKQMRVRDFKLFILDYYINNI
jgi:hypothetical protein